MIRKLFGVAGPECRGQLIAQFAALVAYCVLQGVAFILVVPVLRGLLGDDPADAWSWTAALAAVGLATAATHYLQQMIGFRVALAVSHRLYHRLGDHVSTLPLGWFSGEQVGRLGQLTARGVPQVRGLLAHLLQPLLAAVITPLTVIVAMAFFDWRLALVAAAGIPVIWLTYRWAVSAASRAEGAFDTAAGLANERVVEYVRAQPVLRTAGGGLRGRALLEQALTEQDAAARRQTALTAPARSVFGAVVLFVVCAVIVAGAALGLRGGADVAELVAVLVLMVRFAEPVSELADLGGSLRGAAAALDRIDAVLATAPLPEPARPGPGPQDSSVTLRDVRFGYGGAAPVLDGVSLHLPANSTTAVVGPSGSGKTTLTRLLARFWDTESGAVLLGGVDVRELTGEQLREQVSIVFQDVYLFDSTIRENIAVGRPDADPRRIEEVAGLAGVDEIVARLPRGWDTPVGEGGTALSGGERQRVSLARALLKDAPIMLLDEATSSLDPANEAAVQQTLNALSGRRTLVVVAHRLQTVVAADQIVFLADGRVAETGTHAELLAADGRYADFWRQRRRAREWRMGAVAAG